MNTSSPDLSSLIEGRKSFLAFIRRKISPVELAEDILQASLAKAIVHAPELRDTSRLLPWFYRIINNAIVDAYRSKFLESSLIESEIDVDAIGGIDGLSDQNYQSLCNCFKKILPALKPEYAELINSLDLANEKVGIVSTNLKISPNNLKVRRHRARQALRKELEKLCRLCAKHGCLDCHCSKK